MGEEEGGGGGERVECGVGWGGGAGRGECSSNLCRVAFLCCSLEDSL